MEGRKPTRVADDNSAIDLAELLNGSARSRPIVVVTIPAGRTQPYIDAQSVQDEVGDLADVYVIATGPHTWTFSDRMPALTQVYGGAGRAYPLGHEWVSNPYASPLRFAYDEAEGERATRALGSDALRMAAAAGLILAAPSRHRVRVEGRVVGIPVPERALVKFDGRLAPIAQELTIPEVPLDRVLEVGMRVAGWLDKHTLRLDIRDSLQPPDEALRSYAVGDVVLTEVREVQADRAELLLHPQVSVSLAREYVTANALDDLRTLMTPGEVLPARVSAPGPNWGLTLLDIDDADVPVVAASLIAGGPPWLAPPPPEGPPAEWVAQETATLGKPSTVTSHTLEGKAWAPDDVSVLPAPVPAPRPTPVLLDKKRGTSSAPSLPSAAESMALTIESLRADVASLEGRLAGLEAELGSSNAEREALVGMRQEQERKVKTLEHELQVQRARLRKAKRPSRAVDRTTPHFADPEQGFRYAVLTAWAARTPPGEQASRPLADYDIGPYFLESLEQTPGISIEKVADVVFEIVTGRAHEIAGRDLHQHRESATPNAPYLRRAADGATCWRAALQINTPQARRIHYWVLPGGKVELSRVALHDDFRP